MENIKKRQRIRNLVNFLESKKETIKQYRNLDYFEENIDSIYKTLKDSSYDSIEFDLSENLDVHESKTYHYVSIKEQELHIITIINKDLQEFYFYNINSQTNYEILHYYKNDDNIMTMLKKDKIFNSVTDANNYKSLILKPIKNNYF